MRISDWSSDVCSSDLIDRTAAEVDADPVAGTQQREAAAHRRFGRGVQDRRRTRRARLTTVADAGQRADAFADQIRSEEHTSELQSLMRISYAVFCLKKKKTQERYKLL